MFITKMALIGVGGSVLALVVSQFRKEYGGLVLIGLCLIFNGYLMANLSSVTAFIRSLSDNIPISETYLKVFFKLLGIAAVCQIASGLCEDMGYRSVSLQIEILGKVSILMLSIPILQSLMAMTEQLL